MAEYNDGASERRRFSQEDACMYTTPPASPTKDPKATPSTDERPEGGRARSNSESLANTEKAANSQSPNTCAQKNVNMPKPLAI
ncbi:hypothetical protein ScalyP_jg526 [Parmales sp. scaly parma]|nr:hypothetical protein ScalyP_jg526 [Parmales sp. scaly parma]